MILGILFYIFAGCGICLLYTSIIRLGIGDVTMPLVPAVIEALHGAVDEMGKKETFHGYGPEQGLSLIHI